jgi:cold shock CspA family protein
MIAGTNPTTRRPAVEKGTVKFFDGKRGFGKIVPLAGGTEIFVHFSKIADPTRRYLVVGEPVEYEAEANEKGPTATSVCVLELRQSGTVDRFDKKRGFGSVVADETGIEYFVHYSNIVSDKEFKTLEEGQAVSFLPETEAGGKLRARRVLPDTRMPLERFAVLPRFEEKLDELATLAQPEDWDYRFHPFAHRHPVLWSYLHYTFKRLQAEDKIAYTVDPETKDPGKDQRLACFNTNLVTKNYEPIFAAFHENTRSEVDQDFVLIGFFKESQHPITQFEKRPEAADYFTDPQELIYDRKMELVCNVDHIIEERIDRFPEHFRDKPAFLATALRIAIDRAKRRVLQNYKTAIPMYNRERIQLLLPLCLDKPDTADVALVVGREGRVYKGYTVLTLDMAYNNARLLTRPDREWLSP